MTKKEIESIVKNADKTKYSHVIIFCDSWDYDHFARFVKIGEDIKECIKLDPLSTVKVMEVYNLNLDLDVQLNEVRSYHIEDNEQVKEKSICDRALEFATNKHKGQMRKSIIPTQYIIHPINVAKLIKKYKGNSHNIDSLVAAAYLHDTLEDTDTTYYELVDNFGYLIAGLVNELTTDKNMKNALGKAVYLTYKLQSLTSYAQDLKLCDRLDNVSGLLDTKQEFRTKYTIETLYILRNYMQNCDLNDTQKTICEDIIDIINKQAIIVPPESKLLEYLNES